MNCVQSSAIRAKNKHISGSLMSDRVCNVHILPVPYCLATWSARREVNDPDAFFTWLCPRSPAEMQVKCKNGSHGISLHYAVQRP
jgi:hypothetical protein